MVDGDDRSAAQRATGGPTGARLPPARRRQQLLRVARALVEERGVAALSMEQVAEDAGVSRALVYSYFENRTGLVQALWGEVAALWDVEPMPPVAEMLVDTTPQALFDQRFVENTRWYFDQIERGGLLYHRLLAEPHLETEVEALRRSIQSHNVAWWADLLVAMGVGADRALVFSTIFNGATEQMWTLVAQGDVDRVVIEAVFLDSGRAALARLLESTSEG